MDKKSNYKSYFTIFKLTESLPETFGKAQKIHLQ